MNMRISIANPVLNGNEKKYVNDCLDTCWISSVGKYVDQFESSFARFVGTKHAIACSNGTVAIHLALLALGVEPGDEVIVPTFTYIATANAVRYCGAVPVFADSEADTGNIDPAGIEKLITPKTKGIIVVHIYGHPADMDPIMALANKHHLFVIEDAAEAHGALYKGKKAGSIGDIATFSFFGNKVITTGEGGMITTDKDDLAARMRLLKGQGMDPKRRYWFIDVGYNYRMTNIQAAIGLGQLENVDWHLANRQRVAKGYEQRLKHLADYISLPVVKEWAVHTFWMYSIILKDKVRYTRDEFMAKMAEANIETRPYFYPMHVMPPYAVGNLRFPRAEYFAGQGINVPSHALLTDEDLDYICGEIEKLCISS